MNKIEVGVIAEHGGAQEMMCFLARLTQRGHNIKSLADINELLGKPYSNGLIDSMMKMELHGTIKRFTPITIAIVGASRRFLAQARTNQVGFNYVSASLQYSDYSGTADFVVPYEILKATAEGTKVRCRNGDGSYGRATPAEMYLQGCREDMRDYEELAAIAGNDAAGYKSPQGLRNILIMQGNHEAWLHFIKTRSCNRNTQETQYVAMRIWEELLKTDGGEAMFRYAGPDCAYGPCREGKLTCAKPLRRFFVGDTLSIPRRIINERWPLLGGDNLG